MPTQNRKLQLKQKHKARNKKQKTCHEITQEDTQRHWNRLRGITGGGRRGNTGGNTGRKHGGNTHREHIEGTQEGTQGGNTGGNTQGGTHRGNTGREHRNKLTKTHSVLTDKQDTGEKHGWKSHTGKN